MNYDKVAALLLALDYCKPADASNAALLSHLMGNGFTSSEAHGLLSAIRGAIVPDANGWNTVKNKAGGTGSQPAAPTGWNTVSNKASPSPPPPATWDVKSNKASGLSPPATTGWDVKSNLANNLTAKAAEAPPVFGSVAPGAFRKVRLLS